MLRSAAAALLLLSLTACAAGLAVPQAAAPEVEARELLKALIRFDTINPPQKGSGKRNANETALCRHIQGLLEADGIPSEIIESEPGRGNLVARLRGDGSKRPFLMMAHLDVVNVDPSRWKVDPLSGAELDGRIWGRGALDDKGMAAVCTQALRQAARARLKLSRDIILMLNADEESGGRFGAEFMVKNHWDKIACEFLINEGGRVILKDGKIDVVGIQTAEKVYNDVRIWIRGESGHSSVPRPDNSVYSLGRILSKLEAHRPPIRIHPTVALYFGGLAVREQDPQVAALMKSTAQGDAAAAGSLAAREPRYNALLRSTFVPTIVEGGIRENVLPPDAAVNLNIRLLPGDRLDDMIDELARAAEIPDAARLEVKPGQDWRQALLDWVSPQDVAILIKDRGLDAPASPLDNALYRAIETVSRGMAPEALISPVMMTGATDSRFFRMKGVPAYGLLPLPATEEDLKGFHDHNERVPVESVEFGVKFMSRLIRELGR